MLDLKAKLASAGLVSQEDVDRIEKGRKKGKKSPRERVGASPPAGRQAKLPVAALRDKTKAEVYDGVRRWIEKARLDPVGGTPSADARVYHFPEASGRIGRLVLEPAAVAMLEKGEAGVVAFMSNHGLAHAVVSAAGARSLAELHPQWLRVLLGDDRAGKIDTPTP
jgi:hypothetical protein